MTAIAQHNFDIFFSCPVGLYDDLRQLSFTVIEWYLVHHNSMFVWEHFILYPLLTKIDYLIDDIAKKYEDDIFHVFHNGSRKFRRDALGRRHSIYKFLDDYAVLYGGTDSLYHKRACISLPA